MEIPKTADQAQEEIRGFLERLNELATSLSADVAVRVLSVTGQVAVNVRLLIETSRNGAMLDLLEGQTASLKRQVGRTPDPRRDRSEENEEGARALAAQINEVPPLLIGHVDLSTLGRITDLVSRIAWRVRLIPSLAGLEGASGLVEAQNRSLERWLGIEQKTTT